MSGLIGDIGYRVDQQYLTEDEVIFTIPVKNTSNVEQCFVVKLYNEGGELIDETPGQAVVGRVFANRILPGKTENMLLKSSGEFWNIHDIKDQTLRFDLVADPSGWFDHCSIWPSSYDIVDKKYLKMPAYNAEDRSFLEVAEDLMRGLTILIVVILIAYAVSKFR